MFPTRTALIIGVLVAAVAVVASGLAVREATNSAFTASTENTGNAFQTAALELNDDDAGNSLLTAGSMVPGDSVSGCIDVSYVGDAVALTPVKLFRDAAGAPGPFDAYLVLMVEEGTGGGYGDCAGFAPESTVYFGGLNDFPTDYAAGIALFTPGNGVGQQTRKTYRMTATLANNTPDTYQGLNHTADFTWEVRSS